MVSRSVISIRQGSSVCKLCPSLGGGLVGWAVDGQDMLRGANDADLASNDPRHLAAFPMLPYSNRIGNGRFSWQGKQINLAPNLPPEPHAIHGVGWQRGWTVEDHTENQIILGLIHHGDANWPWPFAASQTFCATNQTLHLTLTVRNLANEAVPLGFGYHPYFDRDGAELSFKAARVLMPDVDGLPQQSITLTKLFDFSRGAEVSGRTIDHCYTGWNGKARIDWANRPYALEITAPMEAIVIYIPDGGDYFCVEPAPNASNALNCPDLTPALPTIAPGEYFTASLAFTAI